MPWRHRARHCLACLISKEGSDNHDEKKAMMHALVCENNLPLNRLYSATNSISFFSRETIDDGINFLKLLVDNNRLYAAMLVCKNLYVIANANRMLQTTDLLEKTEDLIARKIFNQK